jgi:molybdate transport system regulatory protein
MPDLSVRFRLDLSPTCALGPGKIALLEGIARRGSLSQAARDLKMSYRRAWLLLESLNTSFRRPLVITATGGKGGGGAAITPFGNELVAAYRTLESDIAQRARARFDVFARQTVPDAPTPAVARRPVKRREAVPERSGEAPSPRRRRR